MSANVRFERVVAKMPTLLESLQASAALSRDGLGSIPQRGVYVFYDSGVPTYVGRSNRLRQRLLEHGQPNSTHHSATFAFILAPEEAEKRNLDLQSMQRMALQKHPVFGELFREAKYRVSKMKVRVVGVTDPIEQTVFEVYAALALGTSYNDFKTH